MSCLNFRRLDLNPLARCDHYIPFDNTKKQLGGCKLPTHFLCKLDVDNIGFTVSHSQIQDYMKCKFYYYLRQIMTISVKENNKAMPLKRGTMWDKIQEYFMGAIGYDIAWNNLEEYIKLNNVDDITAAKTRAMVRAHDELFKPVDGYKIPELLLDNGIQFPLELNLDEYTRITGFYDAKYYSSFDEVKFSAKPENYLNKFDISSQVGTYFLADDDMDYVNMKVARVPDLKIGSDESVIKFENRLFNDILSRASFYFPGLQRHTEPWTYGVRFYREEFDLEEIRQRYKWIVRDIRTKMNEGGWYREERKCEEYGSKCDYYPICTSGGFISDFIYNIPNKVDDEKYMINSKTGWEADEI